MTHSATCPHCGAALQTEEVVCPSCGAPRPDGLQGGMPRRGATEVLGGGGPEGPREDLDRARQDRHRGRGESDPPEAWPGVRRELEEATRGEFEIVRELGRGGMAAVYLARDPALNREVAIKVMAPGLLMGPGMVDRFRQEAVTIANLHHPNIVTIHTVRQADSLHFFVMQMVDGGSLEDLLREPDPLPLARIRNILTQVGSGLAYAHAQGIIHRDIKPANVLLDRGGNAILTDFGIAKVTTTTNLTQTGSTVGTPQYMSPEQCLAGELSPASDQYSLGVLAYEMLTGRTPFSGTPFAIMQAHTSTEPGGVLAYRPDCPPGMDEAVRRMLAKDPAQRFPGVAEAVEALVGAGGGGDGTRPDRIETRPEPSTAVEARRRRLPVWVAGGVMGVLVAVFVASRWIPVGDTDVGPVGGPPLTASDSGGVSDSGSVSVAGLPPEGGVTPEGVGEPEGGRESAGDPPGTSVPPGEGEARGSGRPEDQEEAAGAPGQPTGVSLEPPGDSGQTRTPGEATPPDPPAAVPGRVEALDVVPPEGPLEVGRRVVFRSAVTSEPSGYLGEGGLEWSSSDTSVALVSVAEADSALLTLLAEGMTYVRVRGGEAEDSLLLRVEPAPVEVGLALSEPSLRFQALEGGPIPTEEMVRVAVTGDVSPAVGIVRYLGDATGWLRQSLGTEEGEGTVLRVGVYPAGLVPGEYQAEVPVAAGGLTRILAVHLVVEPDPELTAIQPSERAAEEVSNLLDAYVAALNARNGEAARELFPALSREAVGDLLRIPDTDQFYLALVPGSLRTGRDEGTLDGDVMSSVLGPDGLGETHRVTYTFSRGEEGWFIVSFRAGGPPVPETHPSEPVRSPLQGGVSTGPWEVPS